MKRYFVFFYLEGLSLYHSVPFYAVVIILPLISLFLIHKREQIWSKRVELIVMGTIFLVGLFLIEGTLRIINNTPHKIEGHHYLNHSGVANYVSENGLNRHNSYGFRGEEIEQPKPERTFRIVAIGGSTTYTSNVEDWEKTYPKRLEDKLREHYEYDGIEVINAGLGGYSSHESLINLQMKVLDFSPDMIIVYHAINDIASRIVPPEYYRGDNIGARKQFIKPKCRYPLCSALFSKVTGTVVGLPIYPETFGYLSEDPDVNIMLGGTLEETLEKNKPIYFERNLTNMASIAKAHGIIPLFVTWAHGDRGYIRADYLKREVVVHNDITRSLQEKLGVEVFDFALLMPKNEEYWNSGGVHVTEAGVEVKSDLFLNYIVESGIIKNDINQLKQKYGEEK